MGRVQAVESLHRSSESIDIFIGFVSKYVFLILELVEVRVFYIIFVDTLLNFSLIVQASV